MSKKHCPLCHRDLPLEQFSGKASRCKECRSAEERARRAARRKPPARQAEPWQLPGEEWRDIPGLEGYYQASSAGRIRSLDRHVEKRDGSAQMFPGTVLRPQRAGNKDTRPYLHVSLSVNGQRVGVFVHQLIALAFLGDAPQDHHVHHINSVTTDNRPCNLEYVPCTKHLSGHHRGEGNPSAILGEQDVKTIRKLLAEGRTAASIARSYGVVEQTISHIKRGLTWKHVQADAADYAADILDREFRSRGYW